MLAQGTAGAKRKSYVAQESEEKGPKVLAIMERNGIDRTQVQHHKDFFVLWPDQTLLPEGRELQGNAQASDSS